MRLLGLFVVSALLSMSQMSFAQSSANAPVLQQTLTRCAVQAAAAGQASVFNACLAASGIILGDGSGDYTGLDVKSQVASIVATVPISWMEVIRLMNLTAAMALIFSTTASRKDLMGAMALISLRLAAGPSKTKHSFHACIATPAVSL